MHGKKIITCLDVREGMLTKGVKFSDNKELGSPVEAAARYCEQGIDEIVLYDFSASHEGRGTKMDTVESVSNVTHVTFAVGGGVKSLDDCRTLFAAGADKVHINTAAVRDPKLLSAAVQEFGSGKIVLSMDVLSLSENKNFELCLGMGRERTGMDAVEWAKRGEAFGVCEIVVNSIDADGTRDGFHIPATRAIAQAVKIPVVASGGGGTIQHIYDILTEGCATVALVASMLHFGTFTVQEIRDGLAALGLK